MNGCGVFKSFIFMSSLMLLETSYAAEASEPSSSQKPLTSSTLEVPLKDIRRFTSVIALIKNNYVEPVDDKKLFDNAIRGLLSNLDPHSRYLDSNELKNLDVEISGQMVGVGLEFTSDENGDIRVIAPLDDSPAEKAGIKPGDIILKIDNKVVNNMTLEEVMNRIRGKKGTQVSLELIRPGVKKVIKLKLVREPIKVNTVKGKIIEGQYGYIRIPKFYETAAADTLKTLQELEQESGGKLKGIVLDLRNNTGGLFPSAIEVANLFLESSKLKNKKIVYTKGREPQDNFEADATKKDVTKGLPIIVLINSGSASGSEIVAGALQDHHRAVILGTKSFGKGSVQTVLPLDDKSAISLTTALYYTPSGRSIQAKGIKPDVEVQDVKIAKPEGDQDNFFSYREEDLAGHFNNASNNLDKTAPQEIQNELEKDKKNSALEMGLARSDFQLYSAINLLKGLQAVKK